jgi:tetratricopeptide (TPR) repeat protein
VLVVPPLAAGEDDAALLSRAEAAFARGAGLAADSAEARQAFSDAADAYEELRRRGAHNPHLYLNQGNAAFLAGRVPEAILAYQRGLRLNPNHHVLREHLEQARLRVQYPGHRGRPQPSSWPAWLPRPTLDLIVPLALLLYLISCVAATRWLMLGTGRRLLHATVLTLAALLAGFVGVWLMARDAVAHEMPLVVVAEDAPFHRGNGATFARHAELPQLPPGLEARRIFQRGDWLQVVLYTGEVGWVHKDYVLVDQ